ncbi:hypothetical protein D3C73_1496030 [compost metagenome]
MSANELVKRGTDFIREAFQHFNAEAVADELEEASLVVLVNLAQQVFRDMRVLFVQLLGKPVGLIDTDSLTNFNFL